MFNLFWINRLKSVNYNNLGIHGTGIATAADSRAAVKKYV